MSEKIGYCKVEGEKQMNQGTASSTKLNYSKREYFLTYLEVLHLFRWNPMGRTLLFITPLWINR